MFPMFASTMKIINSSDVQIGSSFSCSLTITVYLEETRSSKVKIRRNPEHLEHFWTFQLFRFRLEFLHFILRFYCNFTEVLFWVLELLPKRKKFVLKLQISSDVNLPAVRGSLLQQVRPVTKLTCPTVYTNSPCSGSSHSCCHGWQTRVSRMWGSAGGELVFLQWCHERDGFLCKIMRGARSSLKLQCVFSCFM